ncbi:MAG: hypothetical protein RID81_26575 [Sandaracinaceae bacterium]
MKDIIRSRARWLVCLLLAAAAPAAAQPAEQAWLVVPATAGELTPDEAELAAQLEAALRERGVTPAPLGDLHLGSETRELPEELASSLAEAVAPAVEDAAFGRRARVVERVNPLLQTAARHLDGLGRRPSAARAVADLALILARVHAEGGDSSAAQATVQRLLSLVPTPEPDPSHHTHEILALLTRARDALRAGGGDAELAVTARDDGTCNVYLNGQLAGPTPLSLRVYEGDYAVRVQCGEARSRVHLVHLESGRREVEIGASLEAAFVTRPRPHLRYDDRAALTARGPRDAAALATHLDAPRAIVLVVEGARASLELLSPDGSAHATATLPERGDAAAAAGALLSSADGGAPADAQGASRPSEWNWVVGGALIAGGLVALISPVHTLAVEGQCVSSPRPGYCATEYQFGPRSAALTALGLAAIAGGAAWWGLQPIRVGVAADASSARLSLEGRF